MRSGKLRVLGRRGSKKGAVWKSAVLRDEGGGGAGGAGLEEEKGTLRLREFGGF